MGDVRFVAISGCRGISNYTYEEIPFFRISKKNVLDSAFEILTRREAMSRTCCGVVVNHRKFKFQYY